MDWNIDIYQPFNLKLNLLSFVLDAGRGCFGADTLSTDPSLLVEEPFRLSRHKQKTDLCDDLYSDSEGSDNSQLNSSSDDFEEDPEKDNSSSLTDSEESEVSEEEEPSYQHETQLIIKERKGSFAMPLPLPSARNRPCAPHQALLPRRRVPCLFSRAFSLRL